MTLFCLRSAIMASAVSPAWMTMWTGAPPTDTRAMIGTPACRSLMFVGSSPKPSTTPSGLLLAHFSMAYLSANHRHYIKSAWANTTFRCVVPINFAGVTVLSGDVAAKEEWRVGGTALKDIDLCPVVQAVAHSNLGGDGHLRSPEQVDEERIENPEHAKGSPEPHGELQRPSDRWIEGCV